MTYRHSNGFWQQNITEALVALGGTASLQDIYEWVEANAELFNRDLEDWGGVGPMYHHIVRRYMTKMCGSGEVTLSNRGYYRLQTIG